MKTETERHKLFIYLGYVSKSGWKWGSNARRKLHYSPIQLMIVCRQKCWLNDASAGGEQINILWFLRAWINTELWWNKVNLRSKIAAISIQSTYLIGNGVNSIPFAAIFADIPRAD